MRASVKRINEDVQVIMRESQRRSRGKKDGSATHVNGCGEWDNGRPSEFCEAPIDGLTETQARELLKKWGKNELVEKVVPKWLVFLRLLSGPMPIMLWIAAAIECAIANYLDMCILLFIQFANTSISFYETTKAGDALAALKASLKPKATANVDDHPDRAVPAGGRPRSGRCEGSDRAEAPAEPTPGNGIAEDKASGAR